MFSIESGGDMLDFTFLTEEQIFGKDQLDILKKYGTKCATTDFSILLGGDVSENNYTSEGNSGKDRIGSSYDKRLTKLYFFAIIRR